MLFKVVQPVYAWGGAALVEKVEDEVASVTRSPKRKPLNVGFAKNPLSIGTVPVPTGDGTVMLP